MRSIERITGSSINTITKLLTDAGDGCAIYHDKNVSKIPGFLDIQCDEIWSVVYAMEKNVPISQAAPTTPEASGPGRRSGAIRN